MVYVAGYGATLANLLTVHVLFIHLRIFGKNGADEDIFTCHFSISMSSIVVTVSIFSPGNLAQSLLLFKSCHLIMVLLGGAAYIILISSSSAALSYAAIWFGILL